jgi:hypothetical protein
MKRLFTLTACILFLAAGAFAQRLPNPNIRVKHDKFKDSTSILMKGGDVENLKGLATSAHFSAVAIHPGEKLTSPIDGIGIAVSTKSENWLFLDNETILRVILNDKERIILGKMSRTSSDVERGYVSELLTLVISNKDLNKLANAKKVEMQVGRIEFELTEAILADLKEFAGMLVP